MALFGSLAILKSLQFLYKSMTFHMDYFIDIHIRTDAAVEMKTEFIIRKR